ncbi:MAG: hypothetical protein R2941_23150 [Desulfobacterales bacterium]
MADSQVTLKKDDEQAHIPDKQILVTLSWSVPADLDLMAFYRTKDGRTDGIFSDNYEGGSMGTLEEFSLLRLSLPASKKESLEKQDKTAENFSEKKTKPENTDRGMVKNTEVSEIDIQTGTETDKMV